MSFLVQPTSVLTYGEHLELRQSSALSTINVKGGVELLGVQSESLMAQPTSVLTSDECLELMTSEAQPALWG